MVFLYLRVRTGETSDILAQASKARLGRSSRVLTLILLEPLTQAECPSFGRHVSSLRRVHLA